MVSLHIHSNNSDGLLSFEQITDKAKREKSSLVSICDHDIKKRT